VLEFGLGFLPRLGKHIGDYYVFKLAAVYGFAQLLGEDEVDKKVLDDTVLWPPETLWKPTIVVVAGGEQEFSFSLDLFFYTVLSAAQGWKVIYPAAP